MIRARLLISTTVIGAVTLAAPVRADTVSAASCSTADVAAAIAKAARGDTVAIPAGTCAWKGGVTISADKGIVIQGAGAGRIIAYGDGVANVTLGKGTKTFRLAGYSPGFSAGSIENGETVRVFENNSRDHFMQGTVKSLSANTLTVDVTKANATGSARRWLVSTLPLTILVAENGTPLFDIAEDPTFHTEVSGIHVAAGLGSGAPYIAVGESAGGKAVLIHDCWMEQSLGAVESIDVATNRGVVFNCSFDGSSGDSNQLVYASAFRIKNAPATSWTTPSAWGDEDTTGEANFYVETSDFHAFQAASDIDDNGRCVWRHNLMDHSTFGTHGADTSPYGERSFEFYENVGVFNAYSDGTTFNMANGWIGLVRGGTFVVHDNTLPLIDSQDYGSKSDVKMLVMNLQRDAGPDGCWGAGTTNGAQYPAPRQVGMGWVTGAGTDGLGQSSDSITYVGDSEPAYIWANSRQPLDRIDIDDYGTGSADSCTGATDASVNYIVLGRDYFNDSTAKPGYAPYTYPHPLTIGHGPPGGAGAGPNGGGGSGSGGSGGGSGGSSGGGCSCRVAGTDSRSSGVDLLLAVALAAAVRVLSSYRGLDSARTQ